MKCNLYVETYLYDLDLFNLAGVNISSPEPVEKVLGILVDMIEKLEGLNS